MTKELNKKVDEMVDRFYNDLKRYIDVDLLDEGTDENPLEVKRDPFALDEFLMRYRSWRNANKQLIESSADKYGDIVDEYLKFGDKMGGNHDFGVFFFKDMSEKIQDMTANEITVYLNDLAKAIIIKDIEIRALNRIINLSSNQ